MPLFAQTYWVKGVVKEYYSNEPLPFTHIILNYDETHAFAEIDGKFSIISPQPIHALTFKTPQHKEKTIKITKDSTTNMQVFLVANSTFERTEHTFDDAKELIKNVVLYKNLHNPENQGYFSYKSYNKFSLTTERTDIVKSKILRKLENAASKLRFLGGKISHLSDEHHLLLMESIAERRYRSENSQKETILASKVSGIEKPSVFTVTSILQPFTLYSNSVYLAGSQYYSPFLGNALPWYRFQIVDSANVNDEVILTVKFNPRSKYRVDFLQGYLYINATKSAILYVNATPTIRRKVDIEFFQTYQPAVESDSSYLWFPRETISKIIKAKYSHTNTKVAAYNHTYYYDIAVHQKFSWNDFDEVVLDYTTNDSLPVTFWEKNRKIPFTEKDYKTYLLYDTLGSFKRFERLVRLGEGFYYGHLPYGKFNLDFHRLFDVNQHEGVRLGFGMHTNERMIKWLSVGGFVGYGLGDKAWKYGLDASLTISQKPDIRLTFVHLNDVQEAGLSRFVYDQRQFSSEAARRLRVQVMDRIFENALILEGLNLDRYLSIYSKISRQRIDPQYDYKYLNRDNQLDSIFNFTEGTLGAKYAYGEKFIQSLHKKISLGTSYPIFWLQFTKGISQIGGEYSYQKLEGKVQKTFEFAGWGKMNIQASVGKIWGNVPYPKLFNGKGSFREFAAIAHNSFETMDYNEFISDQYFYLFVSHNFGKIYIRKFNKQPSVEISHNFGIGSLRNSTPMAVNHQTAFQSRPMKTLEKGFFEGGLYFNNIFVLKIFGVFAGLGAGAFRRYGYYASDKRKDNILFKVAVDFQL
ncbi:MAG: hypothetical protein OHK0038_05830 [Flammeovirgaceae bacterium]